ncbi:hypothetical protein [Lactiplantibacillus plantarum]|uniref:Uncharacterized protein n=2 Tax=Lactiplantibacillus plantarum TaxID=1590 RepID=A0A162HIC2_LACPN|nr:hypothetical protein [Lactiplantibacillus plantarum]AOB21221.1 hypothetical protein AVR82_16445 [Lactiplantibacillus plantarum]AOB24556.1 hypothetical protein AVR83_16490 [Lactiplantibacillus plantarum]AWI41986.1 hypothetical protein LpLQ80_15860 [Lactiplantibacillus plantarum]KZU93766.1 hypothetical protein A1D15_1737 [Lactiplantibacillus plantarum]KZU96014.1 hypothetical protein Lp19_1169 [Lactiplantibacillus plantarum]
MKRQPKSDKPTRAQRKVLRQQTRQARIAELKRLSQTQNPLQIQDKLILPIGLIFALVVVILVMRWWLG